jgi:DNA-binding response OmpR family regulator
MTERLGYSSEIQHMIYCFGNYELDAQRCELRCAGQLVAIEPKVFEVLVYLLEHRERVVTKEELLEQCWSAAISGDLLSAVVSTCYILGFRKDNPNVFNMLVQNSPHSSGIKCICY